MSTTNTKIKNPLDGIGPALGGRRSSRRTASWAAAIVFVVIVVLALLAIYRSLSNRVEVLAVTTPVPAGQVITASDVHSVQVAGVPGAIKATAVSSVEGKRAAAGLVSGQILTSSAVTSNPLPASGSRLVPLELMPGRVPGGLAPGAVVNVLAAPQDGQSAPASQMANPKVLASGAEVESIGSTNDGKRVVTVQVPDSVSDQLAVFSAAGQVTIVQAPASAANG